MNIRKLAVKYADGSSDECNLLESAPGGAYSKFRCRWGEAVLEIDDYVLYASFSVVKPLNLFEFAEVYLDISQESRVLVLTTRPSVDYSKAFAYYNAVAVDRSPQVEKPSDSPDYPAIGGELDHISYTYSVPCWLYPVIVPSLGEVPQFSVFALFKAGGSYVALLTLSSGDMTAYLGKGPKLTLFLGKESAEVSRSAVLALGVDGNPYRAVEKAVENASRAAGFRMRRDKLRPSILRGLGWCSWNALLTDDLSHENVVKIVRGLVERGVLISWVIVDDGWQKGAVKGDPWSTRVMLDLEPDEKKFPKGFRVLVEDLRTLGVKRVGLWHTINILWGGVEEEVLRRLGVEGFRFPLTKSYVPPPTLEDSYRFFSAFFDWVRRCGFDFVKVDNQWIIHALYWGAEKVGRAAKAVEYGMQLAAEEKGLEILNCMSMAPENYCNFVLSNLARVSIDYIPFWCGDAKLHTLFSIYNSLLFSHIVYPDYDMFMTYDPHALVHLVARIISGGPVYITDRHPEKTDVDLLRRVLTPDGDVVRVDEPALPTEDILFRDPYNEPVLLKAASKVGEASVVAVFNLNRDDIEVEDEVKVEHLPYKVEAEEYAYFGALTGIRGSIRRGEGVKLKLKPLQVEVLTIAPVIDGTAVIGLTEWLLPPALVEVIRARGSTIIRPRAEGTLLYYKNGTFIAEKVGEGEAVRI